MVNSIRFDQWTAEVRGLMRDDPATFKQGYTLANALNAVAEEHALSVLEVCILAEKVTEPEPDWPVDHAEGE